MNKLEVFAVAKMQPFEEMFKEFDKKYPYFLKKTVSLDHFCWNCAEDDEHDVIVDELFRENLIKKLYTSFPDKKNPFRKISIIHLGGYRMDFGFLKGHSFTGFRYLKLAAQNPQRTQVQGLDHVEFVYNHHTKFQFSELYSMIKEWYVVGQIYRENAGDIFEIKHPETGFKLRFVNDFLINVVARNEIIIKQ